MKDSAVRGAQIPVLYLGAKLGGAVGVAVAFSILMAVYFVFNYLILICTLLGSCLRDYIQSMWPALWMSIVMAGAVFGVGMLFQGTSQSIILISQILCGAAVFLGLLIYKEKQLFNEMKSLIIKKNVVVTGG